MKEPAAEVDKLLRLLNTKLDSELSNGLIIVLEWLEGVVELLWDICLTVLGRLVESFVAQNGKDTWDNVSSDPGSAAIFDPLEVEVVVVE